MTSDENHSLLVDIVIRTQAVEDDGHYDFMRQWHTRYNILMQKCAESPHELKKITAAMYELVKNHDIDALLAVNESMSYLIAQDLGGRLDRRVIPGWRAELGAFYIHARFTLESGTRVVIVDEGVNTGTAVQSASAFVRSQGAEPVCVITSYLRYPDGVEELEKTCGCPVHYLADFTKTYPLVRPNSRDCDLCKALDQVNAKLKVEPESVDLLKEKSRLSPTSAYPRNWGYRT
jgi:orotate phosphoribosyltransferase